MIFLSMIFKRRNSFNFNKKLLCSFLSKKVCKTEDDKLFSNCVTKIWFTKLNDDDHHFLLYIFFLGNSCVESLLLIRTKKIRILFFLIVFFKYSITK